MPLKIFGKQIEKNFTKNYHKHQSAFTKSLFIYDNILVAFESLHFIQKHTGNDDFMVIKLDMSKTYDMVEWPYLEAMMRTMGFTKD